MFYVKVPPERIAVLLGREGWAKRRLEKGTGVKVHVDSEGGEVNVIAPEGSEEIGMRVRDVVRAVGLGFAPDKAMVLLEDDSAFQVLDIRDFAGKKVSHIRRLRGRVIGRHGKTRKTIEELAEVNVYISEIEIGVIGPYEEVHAATRAITTILEGSEQRTAYRFLEKQRRARRLAILDSVALR